MDGQTLRRCAGRMPRVLAFKSIANPVLATFLLPPTGSCARQ
jgi:hypothetical protein